MNEQFVSVKVDREERPDVDALYMDAVSRDDRARRLADDRLPTPDGRPFYGGTYFPPEPRHGMPSFRQVLRGSPRPTGTRRARRRRSRPDSLRRRDPRQAERAAAVGRAADEAALLTRPCRALRAQLRPRATAASAGAPKFPPAVDLEFLLRQHARTGADGRPRAWRALTLDRMAAGGMYDQLGGGFHRYSVDARWLVPHFEKMLYDNALLAPAYLHAWVADRRGALPARRRGDAGLRRCASCASRRAASPPPRTPTARARRA